MSDVILQTKDLCKRYGSFMALDKVSLTLNEGDIYGLIGRNGAGKTTFFKCVMGLARASSGTVELCGESTHLDAARRNMGFMINAVFFSYLNPRMALEYLARVKHIHARRAEVDRLLKLVELDGVTKPFKSFSMGMKQRLGLAAALLGSPPVVLLDEPINGLDPQGIADIREVIKNTHRTLGTTFIISSHILSELDLVATRFGFIEQGVLLKEITHENLHEQTKKALVVEVNDTKRAAALLSERLGLVVTEGEQNRLVLEEGIDRSSEVASILVSEGLQLRQLVVKETTLEEYFIQLIGGQSHA